MTTSVDVLFYKGNLREFLYLVILYPTMKLSVVVFLAELFLRWMEPYFAYVIILAGNLLAAIMILSLYQDPLVSAALLLPLIVSVFYFQRARVVFAGITGVITFSLTQLSPNIRINTESHVVLTMLALLIAASLILFSLMTRGIELVESLRTTIQTGQELMVQNAMMQKMNKLDALTDLYNHRAFHEYLDKAKEICDSTNTTLHLAMIDIDNFKQVNDTYGHRVGDVVLKSVATTLQNTLNSCDFAARYGGEEFAVIRPDSDLESFIHTLETFRRKVSLDRHPETGDTAVTVSVGVHEYQPGETKTAFFNSADKALYDAKHAGKNQLAVR